MLLSAAWALGVLALAAFSATGWGLWVLRFFRLDAAPTERLLLAHALGWGVLTFPLLALGLAGMLYPAAILAVVGVGLLECWAARGELAGLAGGFWRRGHLGRELGQSHPGLLRTERIALAATGLLLLLTLPGALGPPAETDSLRAELAQARVWLEQHAAVFVPNYHWNQPPLPELLFALGLALGPDSLPAVIHWWMGVLSALAIYLLGRRLLGGRAAALGALVYAATPPLVYSAASTKQELFLSLYGWLALYAMLAWNGRRERGWLALAGVFAGLGANSKLMGLYTYPALGLLLLWLAWRRAPGREGWAGHSVSALVFCAAALLPVLPWWARNFAITGDPLWPAGAEVFGGRYVTPAMAAFLAKVKNDFGVGRSLGAFIFGLWHMTQNYAVFSDPRTPTPPSLLLFLPGLALGWRERVPAERQALGAILFFCLGVYTFWWSQPQVPRYLYPLWGAASLACGAAAAKLLEWKGPARIAALAGIGFTVTLAAGTSLVFNRQFVPLFLGRESREAYLTRSVSYYADFREVSHLTPPDSRILVLEALSLYYLERDYLMGLPPWEGVVDYDGLASGADLRAALQDLGVTHILWVEKPGRATELVQQMQAAGWLQEVYRNPAARRVTSRTAGAFEPSEIVLWAVDYAAGEAAP